VSPERPPDARAYLREKIYHQDVMDLQELIGRGLTAWLE
jgi:hypothetical protein